MRNSLINKFKCETVDARNRSAYAHRLYFIYEHCTAACETVERQQTSGDSSMKLETNNLNTALPLQQKINLTTKPALLTVAWIVHVDEIIFDLDLHCNDAQICDVDSVMNSFNTVS